MGRPPLVVSVVLLLGALAAARTPQQPGGRLAELLGEARGAARATHPDPESSMKTPELVRSWGYPLEEHKTTTADGYILTLHRIPHGKAGPRAGRPVVFLQHGLEDSSVSWVINRPNQSAGFLLADAGYDVWMGNMRGNVYSRGHVSLDPKSKEWWRFTFDQMVQYDLDALIDTALTTANRTSLHYVGHSQGTLTMFCKLALDSAFHDKIERFFALAPVGHVSSIHGLFHIISTVLYPELKFYYYWHGDGEFLPWTALLGKVTEILCDGQRGNAFCDNLMMLIMGTDNSHQLNTTRTPVYMAHIPAGTSTQNVMHWVQMVRSGILGMYDFGRQQNKRRYGQATPPLYELNKDINTKIHLWWSKADWLADAADISEYLLKQLPKESLVSSIELDGYNHIDFLWGINAAKHIYTPIIEQIDKDYA